MSLITTPSPPTPTGVVAEGRAGAESEEEGVQRRQTTQGAAHSATRVESAAEEGTGGGPRGVHVRGQHQPAAHAHCHPPGGQAPETPCGRW